MSDETTRQETSGAIKLVIGIPTINRADLLVQSLRDLRENCPKAPIFVVDNGQQNLVGKHLYPERISLEWLYEPGQNLGVAGSWNTIGQKAFGEGADFVLMLNDDVVLGKPYETIEALCRSELERDGGPRMLVSSKGWCSFLWPASIWMEIGPFDTDFYPCYFEDNDYAERLVQAGKPHVFAHELDPALLRTSMTIQKDPSLNANFARNERLFAEKWGAEGLFRRLGFDD